MLLWKIDTPKETYSKDTAGHYDYYPEIQLTMILIPMQPELEALTEHPAGAIYRVANYDGTQVVTNKYSEYSGDGTQYKLIIWLRVVEYRMNLH